MGLGAPFFNNPQISYFALYALCRRHLIDKAECNLLFFGDTFRLIFLTLGTDRFFCAVYPPLSKLASAANCL